MIRRFRTRAFALVFAISLLALGGCRHTPDEEQVRQAIAAVRHAAEAGDAGGVVGPLTDDFDGNAGDLDKPALANMLRLMRLRGEPIGVTAGQVGIEHRGGDRMIATLTVTLTSGGHVLPENLGIYRIESAWRNEGGHWRCYSANWTQSMP